MIHINYTFVINGDILNDKWRNFHRKLLSENFVWTMCILIYLWLMWRVMYLTWTPLIMSSDIDQSQIRNFVRSSKSQTACCVFRAFSVLLQFVRVKAA